LRGAALFAMALLYGVSLAARPEIAAHLKVSSRHDCLVETEKNTQSDKQKSKPVSSNSAKRTMAKRIVAKAQKFMKALDTPGIANELHRGCAEQDCGRGAAMSAPCAPGAETLLKKLPPEAALDIFDVFE